MKAIQRTLFASLMAGVLLLTPLNQASAQSTPEPSIVVSIAQLDRQLDTVNYLVEASGFGQMGFLIKVQADQYLKGIDRTKPAGALLYFSEDSPEPKVLGFLPVKNLEDILDTLADNAGEIEEGDEYTTLITDGEDEVLIKQVGDYAFFSDSEELFENIPDNVGEMLGELPNQYNIAFKVFGQRIPQALRDQAIDLIRKGYEAQLDQMSDVDELQAQLQEKNFEIQMEQMKGFINETDYLTIGMNADQESGSMFMDVEFVGLEGSKLAEQCAAAADSGSSRFSGFLMEGSAFNFNVCTNILESDAEQYNGMIDQVKEEIINGIDEDGALSDEELEQIEDIVESFLLAMNETIKSGKIDGGGVLMLGEGINAAIGVQMADPSKFEEGIKKAIALAEQKADDKFEANMNSGSHDGVNFHEFIVPVPEDEEEARKFIGEELTIIVGIGKDAVYLAIGNDPVELLIKAMDASKTAPEEKAVNSQYNLNLIPILRFAASIEGDEVIEAMVDALAEEGQDRIRIVADTTDKGMKMRFEMQDGILKLISVAVENLGGAFGGGGGDDF